MRRRTLLATSAAGLAGLAGCATDGVGGDGNGTGEEPRDQSTDGGESATADGPPPTPTAGEPLAEARIASGLPAQPTLGPDPTIADSVIVAVTDPSSSRCASHHESTFPVLRERLVDTGRTAYVVRTVGFVDEWGDDAAAILEAVHDRAPEAYWGLLAHYFANSRSFAGDSHRDAAETYLAERGFDAAGIVGAAGDGEYEGAVDRDETAARNAGVTGVPHFFCFKDGRLRSDFQGVESVDAFERALGY